MSAINPTKDRDLHILLDTFIARLRRKQILGSYEVAIETAQLLVKVVSLTKWKSLDELIKTISSIGRDLIDAQPREFTCGNVVRRVLALIREEMEDEKQENIAGQSLSMFGLLTPKKDAFDEGKGVMTDQRALIIQNIRDLIDEIRNVDEVLEGMMDDLIHDNEVLLTPTPTLKTVMQFLKRARQKRNFKVLVTECFPNNSAIAHNFAKELAEAKIETTIIPDTATYAVMSGVSKVIVGTRCVFANGGSVTTAGVSNVLECAREHRTPVFAVTGLYKLSPCYPFDRESLIEFGNSGKVLKIQETELNEKALTANPLYDYAPPENFDIYITNV